MPKPLIIRADASAEIGTGHVMRMLALAQAYQRRGGTVSFVCAHLADAIRGRLLREGCKVVRIEGKPGSESDAEQTLQVAQSSWRNEHLARRQENSTSRAHWIVVDGYNFGYEYQKQIKALGVHLLCVDDHGYSTRWCCDVILNQNLDAELWINYCNDWPKAKVLAGAPFCLMREEFLKARPGEKRWGRIERLLLTLGGSDPNNASEATLSLLNSVCARPLSIRVLAGAENPNVDRLRKFKSQHSIEVVQNAFDMPEHYSWADGIISAGGSTCWEWLHAGLPGAIVTVVDNQVPIVEALSQARCAALSLGWFYTLDATLDWSALVRWLENPREVLDREGSHGLIDGMGAERVCDHLYSSKTKNEGTLSKL